MAQTSLHHLTSGQATTSVAVIEVFIHKEIDALTFMVGDSTKNASLTVKKNPSLRSKLETGSFVRIINPDYDTENQILIAHDKTKIFPGKEVAYLPLTKDDELAVGATSVTLTDISSLPIGANVPSLVAKVILALPPKNNSMLIKVRFNDLHEIFCYLLAFFIITGC